MFGDTTVTTRTVHIVVKADPGVPRSVYHLSRLPGVSVDFSRMRRVGRERIFPVIITGMKRENDQLIVALGRLTEEGYLLPNDATFPLRTKVPGTGVSLFELERAARPPKTKKRHKAKVHSYRGYTPRPVSSYY